MGDAFEAYHGALNILRFGWRWGGLQDVATNPDPSAHPYLYVHHVNFGMFLSYALSLVGIRDLGAQNWAGLAGTLAGVWLFYALMLRLSQSVSVAIAGTILLTGGYYYLDEWTFNIHRSWTFAAYAAPTLCYLSLLERNRRRVFDAALLILSTMLLMGADYVYFIYTFIALSIYTILSVSRERTRRNISEVGLPAAVLLGAYALAFIVRQLQVLLGIGWRAWALDFFYQIMNRLNLEQKWYEGDWSSDTTSFYSAHHILNPGFAPPTPWATRLEGFVSATWAAFQRDVLGVALSPGTSVLIAFVAVGGSAAAALALRVRGRGPRLMAAAAATGAVLAGLGVGAANTATPALSLAMLALALSSGVVVWKRLGDRSGGEQRASLGRFSLSMFLACAVMYAVFPTYFFQWYPGLLLSTICAVVWTASVVAPVLSRFDSDWRQVAAMGAVLLSMKMLPWIPEIFSAPRDMGDVVAALEEIQGEPTASNFTPASVASFTKSFSGWLKVEAVPKLLSQGSVSLGDYFMIYEDDQEVNELYRHPKFYVYFKWPNDTARLRWLKARFEPIREGNSYALFEVPQT